MDKAFDPRAVESRWRDFWETEGLFVADPSSSRPAFSMVIPPPNITGRLHVGHGLNNALQDILARWKRMQGFDVLWLPGSDHASIATHVMIERALEKEGISRHDLGREAFMERAWAWKEKYGGEIAEQLRQLGASCDWSRERFTMDEGLSRAVREDFVRLYEEGLIYRDRYLINWCPRCATAVSDLEVVHKDVAGKMWTVRYPVEGGGEIRVATTRPETILGDAAVAVHPDDERYKPLLRRQAVLPVLGRLIPIVADRFVDPEFGTGAVKVTPAHDPVDFQAGQRLGLEPIVVMDEQARMTEAAGPYAGLDRFECRTRLLDQLREEGLLEDEKDHQLSVGHCQRCNTVVEPMISLQWFVRMEPLAGPAIEAVESGRIKIIPEQWAKTYFEWLRNIRDWCISRQLWWGHRIPAWYCDACGETIVSREDPTSCGSCGGTLTQDPDILDTWFSSGLWPFSTLGWPDQTKELSRYYPTDVLVTGYDIIFFWVARMVMLGVKFMDEVPFHAVFFNGLVRDAHGEKISKTKGNTIDMFDLFGQYGVDAVRFTYASLTTPGSDLSLSPGRLDGSRAFANKIWNAVRFARPYLEAGTPDTLPDRGDLAVWDRWILSRCSRVTRRVQEALEAYRFDEASSAIYQFAWHELCDWYLEIIKPDLQSEDPDRGTASRAVLGHTLDRLLRLLHPFMPFITEELWQALPAAADAPGRGVSIAVSAFPRPVERWEDPEAEATIDEALRENVTLARSLRAEMRIPPSVRTAILIRPASPEVARRLETVREQIQGVSNAPEGGVSIVESFPADLVAIRGVTSCSEVAIPLDGSIDLVAEQARLAREVEKLRKELAGHEKKLSNRQFMERARPEAVEKVKTAQKELTDRIDRLGAILSSLGSPPAR